MKNLIIIFLVIALLGGVAVGGFWGYGKYKDKVTELDEMTALQSTTKSQLDAYGVMTEVLTVLEPVRHGYEILPSNIGKMTVPVTSTNASTLLNVDNSVKLYAGVDLEPNVQLTDDIVTVDSRLNTFNHWWQLPYIPVEANIGSYIDIRVRLPQGEEYGVFSHVRIADMDLDSHQVKFDFDESQTILFNVLQSDLGVYRERGFRVYAVDYKYPAFYASFPFYPVSLAGEAALLLNPHINDLQKYVNRDLRANMIARLDTVDSSQYGPLSSEIDKVFEARKALSTKRHQEAAKAAEEGGTSTTGQSSGTMKPVGGSDEGTINAPLAPMGSESSDPLQENIPEETTSNPIEQSGNILKDNPAGDALEDFSDLTGGGQ